MGLYRLSKTCYFEFFLSYYFTVCCENINNTSGFLRCKPNRIPDKMPEDIMIMTKGKMPENEKPDKYQITKP